jgi:arsenite-transporting ATPase
MVEYILYGGKGGVGKTTCAAATGLELADRGEQTLLVSTDPAHSLSDTLKTDLSGEPTWVEENLWGVEADPEAGQTTYRTVLKALAADFREAGIQLDDGDIDRLFAAGFVPGSDEVAALEFFSEYGNDNDWNWIVFDTAPTGHTLRLLTLPDVLLESMTTATKVRGQVRRLVDSARSMVVGPAAFFGRGNDKTEIDVFRERMDEIAGIIRDPARTDFRVVLLPETLAIDETRRLIENLRSFGVPVETLLINRVLESPPDECERCQERMIRHETQLERVHQLFPNMNIQTLPDRGAEVYGRTALEQLAEQITV